MKTRLLLVAFVASVALAVHPAQAAVTCFSAPGGDYDITTSIYLTQTGEVFIEAGGTMASTAQVDDGATIWVDGVQVMFSDHSIRDASQSAVNALWDVVLGAGPHTIRTQVVGNGSFSGANNTYSYIRLEDEPGPYDQQTITNITNAYEAADTALQEEMTTLLQNAETDLQNQIDATNANVTDLQSQLNALVQQVQENQSDDEAAISQLEQQIAALQSGQTDLQNQLERLTDLEQAHEAALQQEIDSVSSRVTVLSNTTATKSSLGTSNALIYGAAGVGATGTGIGAYLLASGHDQPELDNRDALASGSAASPAPDDGGRINVFDNSSPPASDDGSTDTPASDSSTPTPDQP